MADGHVWAIVLAAGTASRAGAIKQLFELNGKPLLQHAIDNAAASQTSGTVVVLGHEAETVLKAIDPGDATVVINPAFATGQASSLVAGVAVVPDGADAAIVLLGDQPGVDPFRIDRVIRTWRATQSSIVLPRWKGERGNPVIFARSLFSEIQELEGDTGARAIFRKHEGDIAFVDFDEAMPPDVDTPEDYAALLRNQER